MSDCFFDGIDMNQEEIYHIIKCMLTSGIKGQIQIDFCGDRKKAKVKFTNISLNDLIKFKMTSHVTKSDIYLNDEIIFQEI